MLRNQAPEQRAAEAERSRQRLATATPEQRAAATERKRQWRVANPTKAKAEARLPGEPPNSAQQRLNVSGNGAQHIPDISRESNGKRENALLGTAG